MGILDGLKRTLNIGGCRVLLALDQDTYPQGALVSGTVSIWGGEFEQRATNLAIVLEEFWTEPQNKHRKTVFRTRVRKLLHQDLAIPANGEQDFPFALPLPINARLTTGPTGWRLKVDLEIAQALDPSVNLNLAVHEAPEFRALAEACAQDLDFTERPNSWRWAKDGFTSFPMFPTAAMKAEFDRLTFRLTLTEPERNLRGTITFDLQEKSFQDWAKALFGMDQMQKELSLSREQVLLPEGTPNFAEIARVIRPMLAEIVRLRTQFLDLPPTSRKDRSPGQAKVTKATPSQEFDPKCLDN